MTLQLNTVVNVLMAQDQTPVLINSIFNLTDLFMYYFGGNRTMGSDAGACPG